VGGRIIPAHSFGKISSYSEQERFNDGTYLEVENIRKNGTHVSVEMSSARIKIKDQPMILVVCRDITDRKRAEAAWLQAKEDAEEVNRRLEKSIEQSNLLAREAVAWSFWTDGRAGWPACQRPKKLPIQLLLNGVPQQSQ